MRQITAKVIVVNGPAGVGKTTVGRFVAQLGRNSVCIHGDDIKQWIVNRVDGEVETGLGFTICAMAAAHYVLAGYDLIVCDYVFEHPRHVQRFKDDFLACVRGTDADATLYLVTLWADLAMVIEREAMRHDRKPLGDLVEASHRSIGRHLSEFGLIVENVRQKPAEIARQILTACDAPDSPALVAAVTCGKESAKAKPS